MSGRPVWDAKPNIKPGRLRDLFGPKAKVVRRGDGKYTVSGSNRNLDGPSPSSGPFGGYTRDQALPDQLIGREGVLGRFAKQPRLNPENYIVHPARLGGGFFAEPRTELSGLPVEFRRDIAEFDRRTEAQQQRMNQATEESANQASATADQSAQRLGQLNQLSGVGFGESGGTLSDLARSGATAATAPEVAFQGDLPTTIRSEGRGLAEAALAGRQQQRAQLISDARTAQLEQVAAERQAEIENSIALRGQNTSLLAQILSNQNRLELERLGQAGDLTQLLERLSFERDQLASDNANAAADRASREAIEAGKEAGRNNRAASSGSADKSKKHQAFLDRLDDAFFTTRNVTVTDDEGNRVGSQSERVARQGDVNLNPIINSALRSGITPEGVVRLIGEFDSSLLSGANLGEIRVALRRAGVKEKTLSRVWKRLGLGGRSGARGQTGGTRGGV